MEFANQVLWLEWIRRTRIGKRLKSLPSANLFPPWPPQLKALADFIRPSRFEFGEKCVEEIFRIRGDRQIGGEVLSNVGPVDVYVNYASIWGKGGELAGDPIVESRADGNQQITFRDGHIRCVSAMHSQHAETKRMCGRKPAQ